MSDGTPPNEGEHPSAAAPPPPTAAPPPYAPAQLPPYAAAPPYAATPPYAAAPPAPYGAPTPPPGGPVPPYGAGAGSYTTQFGSPPAGPHGGAPRQEYPGAPPTWGPGPGAGSAYPPAPPSGGGSSVLAILALVAAILGVLASFVPFVGALFAWVLIPTAIVLAIIALVRRSPGKGMAIAALIVGVVGVMISIVWAVAIAVFGGLLAGIPDFEPSAVPDEEYVYPSLSAPEFGPEGTTVSEPLAAGTTVTIHDDDAGQDIWQLTVGPLEDITAAAAANDETAPAYGTYAAVPVELTNLTEEPIDLAEDYSYVPYSWLTTGDGGEADIAFLYNTPDYPGVWDLSTIEPGDTVTYYEVFDVAAGVTTTGTYVVQLDSGQTLHWGPGAP